MESIPLPQPPGEGPPRTQCSSKSLPPYQSPQCNPRFTLLGGEVMSCGSQGNINHLLALPG